MRREIVLDTETTGLSFQSGDRIIEIGAVELIDGVWGEEYRVLINPERSIPKESIVIHGITEKDVEDAPTFKKISEDFLAFLDQADVLIAHNAKFDINFLSFELKRLYGDDYPHLDQRFEVIDTIKLCQEKYGFRMSLDRLCERLHIDTSHRVVHGALLDAKLLAKAYVLMNSGQVLLEGLEVNNKEVFHVKPFKGRPFLIELKEAEARLHQTFFDSLSL